MALGIFERNDSKNYWIKGWVEFEGTRIAGPYRCSSRSPTKAGAQNWIATETEIQRRRYLLGDEAAQTFSDAILIYNAKPKDAKRLILVELEIGHMPLGKITGNFLKSLGSTMKPEVCTDTWWREIVSPASAVINNAHAGDASKGCCREILIICWFIF
jgi:hypothetical protein